ncbi:hypothetical protein ABVK25_003153 [Lepraria finkii]|uniref:Uncharacterized protein n=1 Tax=Lepraria finkii TaxID=1340010 RepID=A0ABR4BFZ2_9LECA
MELRAHDLATSSNQLFKLTGVSELTSASLSSQQPHLKPELRDRQSHLKVDQKSRWIRSQQTIILPSLPTPKSSLTLPIYPRASSPEPLPGSSPKPPSERSTSDKQLVCTSCGDQCISILSLPCANCNECLASYVESALQFGETFPPQCYRVPFTLQILRASPLPKIVTDFEAKQAKIAAANSLLYAESGYRVIIPEDKSLMM